VTVYLGTSIERNPKTWSVMVCAVSVTVLAGMSTWIAVI
jgi:hypothetical protein